MKPCKSNLKVRKKKTGTETRQKKMGLPHCSPFFSQSQFCFHQVFMNSSNLSYLNLCHCHFVCDISPSEYLTFSWISHHWHNFIMGSFKYTQVRGLQNTREPTQQYRSYTTITQAFTGQYALFTTTLLFSNTTPCKSYYWKKVALSSCCTTLFPHRKTHLIPTHQHQHTQLSLSPAFLVNVAILLCWRKGLKREDNSSPGIGHFLCNLPSHISALWNILPLEIRMAPALLAFHEI